MVLGRPTAKIPEDESQEIVQAMTNGPPRPIHCRPEVRFRYSLTVRGHIKTLVYSDPTNGLEVLHQRVEKICWEIRLKPRTLERVRTSYEKKS
jgi:hypothetical protein